MDLQLVNEEYDNVSSDIGYLWEEAKTMFYKEVGEAQIAKLNNGTSLRDTVEGLNLAHNKVSKECGTHTVNVGKTKIDVELGRIMTRLELMLQIGNTAMEFGPGTVSLVWSPFRMIFIVRLPGYS